MKKILLLLLSIVPLGSFLHAQTTSSNTNAIVIDMIPDMRDPSATPTFYVSRHAVSPEQYCAFLNAVDTQEGRLYHQEWGDMTKTNWSLLTIARSNNIPPFKYIPCNYATYRISTTRDPLTGLDKAVSNAVAERTIMKGVPLDDVARFCNWLANDQPTGDIGNEALNAGPSYTVVETRDRQPDDDFYTKTMYDPKFPNGTQLKSAYMSVNRFPGAAWRLPTVPEFSEIFSPVSWGSLDSDPTLWYWTEDSYTLDMPPSMLYQYHTPYPCNTGGYYRIRNGGAAANRISLPHVFQNLFLPDTGFCVVFSADTLPQSGFRILTPTEASPNDPSSNPTTPPPPLLPPVLPSPTPPPVVLPPTINQ